MKGKSGAALTLLILSACAQVREISGGASDNTGPLLVEAQPPSLTTRFASERILLRFDERVQVETGRDRLLVSPPLDEPPTIRIVRANEVEIVLNAPLRPNTTYTFSLDGAVKDLTEGNNAAGMDYTVSTGLALDSMVISGGVLNAFTGARENGVLVMVHDGTDTTHFKNSRPLYATRSDTSGNFALRHLKPGAYRLTALRDQNSNYKYDLPNEQIAFASETIEVSADSSVAPITLHLFQEQSAVQTLREAVVMEDGAWQLVLARPAEQVQVKDIERSGGTLTWWPVWSTTRDTVLLWPSDTATLSQGRYAIATESGPLDTLRYRALRKMRFYTKIDPVISEEASGVVVHLRSSRPINSLDRERFALIQDSLPVPFTVALDSADRRHIVLEPQLARGASATLTLLPKAVRDIYSGHNDTLRIGLGRSAEVRTGALRITLKDEGLMTGNLLVQLLDAQGRTIRSANPDPSNARVDWERLPPGIHRLRSIEDLDNNGRWDTGQWATGRQPERVWYYQEPLNVRAAWDLGIDWKLSPP